MPRVGMLSVLYRKLPHSSDILTIIFLGYQRLWCNNRSQSLQLPTLDVLMRLNLSLHYAMQYHEEFINRKYEYPYQTQTSLLCNMCTIIQIMFCIFVPTLPIFR